MAGIAGSIAVRTDVTAAMAVRGLSAGAADRSKRGRTEGTGWKVFGTFRPFLLVKKHCSLQYKGHGYEFYAPAPCCGPVPPAGCRFSFPPAGVCLRRDCLHLLRASCFIPSALPGVCGGTVSGRPEACFCPLPCLRKTACGGAFRLHGMQAGGNVHRR